MTKPKFTFSRNKGTPVDDSPSMTIKFNFVSAVIAVVPSQLHVLAVRLVM